MRGAPIANARKCSSEHESMKTYSMNAHLGTAFLRAQSECLSLTNLAWKAALFMIKSRHLTPTKHTKSPKMIGLGRASNCWTSATCSTRRRCTSRSLDTNPEAGGSFWVSFSSKDALLASFLLGIVDCSPGLSFPCRHLLVLAYSSLVPWLCLRQETWEFFLVLEKSAIPGDQRQFCEKFQTCTALGSGMNRLSIIPARFLELVLEADRSWLLDVYEGFHPMIYQWPWQATP
jgi:hypothetical protein